MRRAGGWVVLQPRQVAGVVAELGGDPVVGVAALEVREDDRSRAKLAERFDERRARRFIVLDARVGQAEVASFAQPQHGGGPLRLGAPRLRRAAATQLAGREVEDGGFAAEVGGANERAAAQQLRIVGVGRDGEEVDHS